MKSCIRDILFVLVWLVIFAIATVLKESIAITIVSIIFLIYFYIDKESEYLYPLIILVMLDYPGYFYFGLTDNILNISFFKLSLTELFSIIAIMKYGLRTNGKKNLFLRPYKLYISYYVVLITIGIVEGMKLSGTSGRGYGIYSSIITLFLLYPLFLTMPKLYKNKLYIDRTIEILNIMVILNIILQIYHIITGASLASRFGGFGSVSNPEDLIRPVYGTYICFITLVFSIYKIGIRQGNIIWHYLILVLSFGSILISATRGWILAFILMIFISWFVISKLKIHELFKNTSIILVIILIFMQFNIINSQVHKSMERLSTIELIFKGDPTAGGTNARLTERHYPVMNKFYEKPIIGWGFSAVGYDSYDVHVGNQSLLMVGGIIGYTIVIICLLWIIMIIYKSKREAIKNNVKQIYDLYIISFLSLFVIHSTSTDLFSFMASAIGYHYKKLFFLAIYLSMLNSYIYVDKHNNNKNL